MKSKSVYIIAGPNGSGKTTFAKKFLPQYAKCLHFVNADLIAQGLSPFSPRIAAMKAGRLVLEQIRDMAGKDVDFAFETTLSGKAYIDFLKALKRKGYRLHLFFLWIPSPELALARIKGRVAEGGHDVPAEDVRRRFDRGIQNFFRFYRQLLDTWMFFDNAGDVPQLIAEEKDGEILIIDKNLYNTVTRGVI
ncbi:MAG: zeta toxin family protein [Candidatus Omnitrophica bacterium]|nr:zeta toxin family protein [Candidatus Omnitrophota bacterium]